MTDLKTTWLADHSPGRGKRITLSGDQYIYTYNSVIQTTSGFNDPSPTAYRASLLAEITALRDTYVADPGTYGELYVDATQTIFASDYALDQSVFQWSYAAGNDTVTITFPSPYVAPSAAATISGDTGTVNYFIMRKTII